MTRNVVVNENVLYEITCHNLGREMLEFGNSGYYEATCPAAEKGSWKKSGKITYVSLFKEIKVVAMLNGCKIEM